MGLILCETLNLTHNCLMSIDIIGPDKIHKSVSALAMVPKTGAITRVGRQAYTVMMLIARDQGIEDEKTGLFTAPLNSVIRGFDGSKGTVEELKRHLRSMVTHIVEWQSPSPGEASDWSACGLLSQVNITKKGGENWLSWAYPPALRQEMLSPQRYAQIRRSTIAQFRSHAGLALYEICARYKDNPSHKTSKQHWHWWLPVLTGKPVPDQIKTEFRFFNRDTIKPAIEEVNEVSEILVSAQEFKVGRSIEFIQFQVNLKPQTSVTETKAIDLSTVACAHRLGIDPDVAEDLYIRYGELAFGKSIAQLEARISMPSAAPILSRQGYLKSLLAGRAVDTPRPRVFLEKPSPKILEVNASEKRFAALQQSESDRVRTVRSEIEALNEQALNLLLKELKVQFIERGMSQAVMQRLDNGKWQSALIMGELIRYYWKKTRQIEWTAGESSTLQANGIQH